MSLKIKKLVLFDFDGVIADTLELSYKIHKDANGKLSWEKYQTFSEGNFHEMIGKYVREESYTIPQNFYELYEKNLNIISIHEIIRDAILKLEEKYRLSIISSSNTSYISNFLKKENIFNCFDDILGLDVHTDKIFKINSLLKKYEIEKINSIFITDSLGDILDCNNCGIRAIGVTWGINKKETLEKGRPVMIIEDPRFLLETIQNVLK